MKSTSPVWAQLNTELYTVLHQAGHIIYTEMCTVPHQTEHILNTEICTVFHQSGHILNTELYSTSSVWKHTPEKY